MNGIHHHPPGASISNGARPTMSASPAAMQGTTPNGENAQPRPKRRRPQTDPMRKPQRPLKHITRPLLGLKEFNTPVSAPPQTSTSTQVPSPSAALQELAAQGATVLPLVTTPRALREALRHHVIRLQQSHQAKEKNEKIDMFDESQFVPPVRLHRRDPRAPPSGAGAPTVEEDVKDNIEEDKERERQEMQKEERRRIREENQAKIAPSTTKKAPSFQKKTEQVYRADDTPEAQKRSKLRYEEALPWHLEDFENKQTWVGSYESELSDAHVMLRLEQAASAQPGAPPTTMVRIVPLEKWYRFIAKGKGKGYTADEADKNWSTTGKLPKFIEKAEQMAVKREREELARNMQPGRLRTRIADRDDDEVKAKARMIGADDDMPIKRENDADDIDFNMEDDFADDEEGLNGLFEGDEAETKDAQERLKRDQLAATVFDLRSEAEVYKREEEEREAAEKQRQSEKATRKALKKREKNYDYASSDSDRDPYATSSESETDSETERQREKERKEEEEQKAAEQNGKANEGEKVTSGASTKGDTTPSGVHKSVEIAKTKKRPGSPNLSEASGNESARKKHKKKHGENRLDASRKSSLVRLSVDPKSLGESSRRGAASGSESEMTDNGRKRKQMLKLKSVKSPRGTPSGSRAGSPDATGSRAGSPLSAGGQGTTRANAPAVPEATWQEIWHGLPPEGCNIPQMIAKFGKRAKNKVRFITIVKAVSIFDKTEGLIKPREEKALPSPQEIDEQVRKAEARAKTKPKA